MKFRMHHLWTLALVLPLCAWVFHVFNASASTQDDIAAKNQQIEELQKQIDQYQSQIDVIHSQALTLQGQVNALNAQISQISLEIQSLNISISKTNLQIADTQSQITDAENRITKDRQALAQYLLLIYKNDQENLTSILLKHDTLSDFFNDLNSVETTQDDLKATIDNIKTVHADLEDKEDQLEDQLDDLRQQQNLEQLEKDSLDQAKAQKDKLLKDTKGQESKFQQLVTQSKTDITRLQSEITYLTQNGVSVDDAIKYGNLAAISVGIRPAFLLAELEIESGLGKNVGKCNRPEDPPSKHWQAIMHPRDHQPFLTITSQLGLDPNNTAVSCPQFINGKQYGWGGAMGPAQFIPSTWIAYVDRVTAIVGHPANPWNIEDAFTAAAIKLANGGANAKTAAAEIAASKAYYSGNSKCSTAACNSYANSVQRTAAEIEKSL
ncbi:MAG TPA: hypothetical protein VG866_01085 [Candidatus Paceibacterota bacterium]|nr:hypothetical protein [Candidatus Paceibacterota bacterium]